MECVLLECISGHMKEEVIGKSQNGFTKSKSHLINLITIYDEITGLVDKGRAKEVIYLDFKKAFDVISHSILISKLGHYSLGG